MTNQEMNKELAAAKIEEVDLGSILAALPTTSSKIRYLTSIGWKRGAISRKLEIRYQHVRNVQLQPLKSKFDVAGKRDLL